MIYMNGKKVTDIGGIAEVQYNGQRLWSKYLFKRVVVVGDSSIGFSFSKDDGTTFTTVPIAGSSRNLKAVKRIGDEVFVAGDGGFIAKTADLDNFATWTVLTYDTALNYIDICEGGGKIVILAEGNKCSVANKTGGSFVTVSMPGTNLGPMAFGNGVFVSPSGTWGGNGAYSTDGGATWNAVQICAYKRSQPSGWPPELYPCRNICFGAGKFFCVSGMYDGSNLHYEYAYSTNGVNWQKAETSVLDMFCGSELTMFFNGNFYAFDTRDTYRVSPSNMATYAKNFLWDYTMSKYSGCAVGDLALLASSGGYNIRGNYIGTYKDVITDESCLFVKQIPLTGTIREVLAI